MKIEMSDFSCEGADVERYLTRKMFGRFERNTLCRLDGVSSNSIKRFM